MYPCDSVYIPDIHWLASLSSLFTHNLVSSGVMGYLWSCRLLNIQWPYITNSLAKQLELWEQKQVHKANVFVLRHSHVTMWIKEPFKTNKAIMYTDVLFQNFLILRPIQHQGSYTCRNVHFGLKCTLQKVCFCWYRILAISMEIRMVLQTEVIALTDCDTPNIWCVNCQQSWYFVNCYWAFVLFTV